MATATFLNAVCFVYALISFCLLSYWVCGSILQLHCFSSFTYNIENISPGFSEFYLLRDILAGIHMMIDERG